MAYRPYERSIPEIITDLLGQFPTLVRKETQLARAEISEKITQMGVGIALIAGGAVLLIPALVILLEAGVAALEQAGLDPAVSALIAGGGALLIGIVLLMVGISRLKAENLVPQKTIHRFQEDASMAKRQVRSDDEYERAA
jgi:F0F1-type ATP synthase assembly protein I